MTGDSSEPFPSSSEPISGAVSEHIAARRLGVSLDMLRRDRRTGKLGIPFIKLGEGKRGLVRYDLADLDLWVETKKQTGRGPASHPLPVVVEAAEASETVEPRTPEPSARRRPSPPRTPWEALAETVLAEPEDDPFAVAGRAAPRRQGSGDWGH